LECGILEGLYAASQDWVEARVSLDVYAQRDAPQMMIGGGVGGSFGNLMWGLPRFFLGGNSSSLKEPYDPWKWYIHLGKYTRPMDPIGPIGQARCEESPHVSLDPPITKAARDLGGSETSC